ncbi:MAG TPA: hypothetical protein VF342_06195 [Alphaproteobacteria bacterium]
MPVHSILVGFPADGWRGPALANWEPGFVQDEYLALRTQSTDDDAESDAQWIGCHLRDIDSVRYCAVTDDRDPSCLQTAFTIRGAGTLYAYASEQCLDHLREQGVSATEMDAADVESCRILWGKICDANQNMADQIRGLVNSVPA